MAIDAPSRGLGRLIYPSRDALARLRELNAGEEKILDVLDRTLPDEWELYVQPHLNGLRPDFLCLHPTGAAVVVEVKDWTFDIWELTWKSREGAAPLPIAVRGNERLEQRNPIEQISAYRSLVAELSDANPTGACLDVRGVLAFPFCDTETGVPAMAPAIEHRRRTDIVIIGRDALALCAGLRAFAPLAHTRRDGAVAAIRNWLVEPETYVTDYPVALTRRQRELVTTRTESGYRRIRGAPGSGKSLVLAARAAELSRESKDVLVVCFNHALVGYLRAMAGAFGAIERQITWLGFHEWCARVMAETGRYAEYKALWKAFPGPRVLNEELPAAVARALDDDRPRLATRYDAVLVDEGQDYLPEWWACLRRVCNGGGEMVLAADPGQNVFGRAQTWTESKMTGAGFSGSWTDLGVSHRMPWDLIVHARAFAEQFLADANGLLPEVPPLKLFDESLLLWRQVAPDQIVTATSEAFVEVLHAVSARPVPHALMPGEVVLLAESNVTGKAVVQDLAEKGIRVSHTFTEGRTGRAARRAFSLDGELPRATTPFNFKGWEAPAIVVCITRGSRQTALAMLYSAITRLKAVEGGSLLTVVCAEPRLSRYGATWMS